MRPLVWSFNAALVAILSVGSAPSRAFDVAAFQEHLRQVRDLEADELIDSQRPYGPYLFRVPNAAPDAEYLDPIATFFELTEDERELLRRHDFMVSERLAYESFGSAMREIWHADLPLYVSSDAILHALHRSYVNILGWIEENHLMPMLEQALDEMDAGWPALEARYAAIPGMRASLDDVDVYLTVARSLLAGEAVASAGGNDAAVRALLDLVEAEQVASVALFNEKPRLYDFSQLKPRGHYAQGRNLPRYFRSMMWLGRTELRFTPPDHVIGSALDPAREIVDAFLLRELADGSPARGTLDAINATIRALVGEQDNMILAELDRLAEALAITSVNALLDTEMQDRVQAELQTGHYSGQEINSQILFADPMDPEAIAPPRAFLLIGQRFVLDSFVTAGVVYDKIRYKGVDVFRGLPSTLDVLYALGNDDVLPLLQEELDRYKYAANLSALRYLIDGYDESYWRQSLYTVWLHAIRSLAESGRQPDVPQFMRTGAWQQQKMNTQLASWTELRHDNLLYAKQSYTGGAVCSYPRTYIEPVPQLYRILGIFADDAVDAFGSLLGGSARERIEVFFTDMSSIMRTLTLIAEKELTNEPFDAAELVFLSEVLCEGGVCTIVEGGWYRRLFFEETDAPTSVEDLLIADVHTQPTDAAGGLIGRVLHVATGRPEMGVFIATPPGQPRTAFAGPVYSYLEHVTLDFERLSDSEWQSLYETGPPARPDWTHVYLADANGRIRDSGRRLVPAGDEPRDWIVHSGLPARVVLAPAQPNPFNPSTRLSFRLDASGETPVRLTVYDTRGRHVRTLVDEPLSAGTYHARWDGTDSRGHAMASGTYHALLQVGEQTSNRKLVLLR
jgi:hypothetical protein